MDLADAFKEFVTSFGVPFRVIMGYGKFTPFIIMLIAGMSFFYSNRARMRAGGAAAGQPPGVSLSGRAE